MTKTGTHPPLDLRAMARRAMMENGFAPEMPPDAALELEALDRREKPETSDASIRDLRGLLWSSIDNSESRDLDQLEYAEQLS
ncbi:MAG TPA: hypothetical protein VE842_16945, partial [Pyrinomonadaceae bacterium]|nr:hypothetical protein [Pyrinomonadaceae bacterium]